MINNSLLQSHHVESLAKHEALGVIILEPHIGGYYFPTFFPFEWDLDHLRRVPLSFSCFRVFIVAPNRGSGMVFWMLFEKPGWIVCRRLPIFYNTIILLSIDQPNQVVAVAFFDYVSITQGPFELKIPCICELQR